MPEFAGEGAATVVGLHQNHIDGAPTPASTIGAGEAMDYPPQGQISIADPAPDPIVGEGAGNVMPQGQLRIAPTPASPLDAGATATVPQGHYSDASASIPPVAAGEAIAMVPQGHSPIASPAANPASSLDALCGNLMQLQRDRIFAIRAQSRCDRSVEAYIRIRLGFSTDPSRMSDAERKRLAAMAKRIKTTVERGLDQNTVADEAIPPAIQACSAVVLRNVVARQPWDDMRAIVEQEMRTLARQLPAWDFVAGVAGVSDLGLAVIVGEAGNLGDYPKKGHLWKRLGLAVLDGRRQGNPGPGATAEDWVRHGYKAARRAEVYAFLDDVMFRSQWRGDRDEDGKNPMKTKKPVAVPAHPIGRYGEHYGRKKAEYLERWAGEDNGKAHAENAARRYMAKAFIRDLWIAWRGGQSGFAARPRLACPRAA